MKRYSPSTGRKLYRSRNGIIFGVCRGMADHFDFPVFWIRAIVVGVFICTGFWPIIGIYILAALLMKAEPTLEIGGSPQGADNREYVHSRQDPAERLKRKWRHLENRIRRMEDKITSREYDWNNRFFS
jgi:phage shock protein C